MAEEKDIPINDEAVDKGIVSFRKRILSVQTQLSCPKTRPNDFGGFNYRSCEDILMAVKPLLKENGLILTIQDELISTDKGIYIQAIATLCDVYSNQCFTVRAYAKEISDHKKMNEAQLIGATSSYARKYALNGLFCIDDNQDPDAFSDEKEKSYSFNQVATNETKQDILKKLMAKATTLDAQNKVSILIDEMFNKKTFAELTLPEARQLLAEVQKWQ